MKIYFDETINDYVYKVSDIIKIQSVKSMDEYKLMIGFSTGEKKIYDVKPLLENPIFFPLKNMALFNKAHIGGSNLHILTQVILWIINTLTT